MRPIRCSDSPEAELAFHRKVLYIGEQNGVVWHGLGGHSGACPMDWLTTMKRPSAFLPLAMSVAALAVVLGHVAMFGAAREADEGAAAHTFQLLLIAQVPIVVFFAIKWLPRAPRQALTILLL